MEPLCIVTEFLPGGDLYSLLKSQKQLSVVKVHGIVKGIAAGSSQKMWDSVGGERVLFSWSLNRNAASIKRANRAQRSGCQKCTTYSRFRAKN